MEDLTMKKLIRCEFSMDTVCVGLKCSDDSIKAIGISRNCNGGKADGKE